MMLIFCSFVTVRSEADESTALSPVWSFALPNYLNCAGDSTASSPASPCGGSRPDHRVRCPNAIGGRCVMVAGPRRSRKKGRPGVPHDRMRDTNMRRSNFEGTHNAMADCTGSLRRRFHDPDGVQRRDLTDCSQGGRPAWRHAHPLRGGQWTGCAVLRIGTSNKRFGDRARNPVRRALWSSSGSTSRLGRGRSLTPTQYLCGPAALSVLMACQENVPD
jgi:hypothetical protein